MHVKAADFKTRCLALMTHVQETGEEVVITKRGKIVARLVAARGPAARRGGYGSMKAQTQILDPKDPLGSTGEAWDAEG
jgi:prevent-host-death family protein